MRVRLDVMLAERGLAESREKAQALVLAGEVTVDGVPARKPGQPVSAEAELKVRDRPAHVSRGGLKLEAAIDRFGIQVAGRICLDVGASTGGFTDCLLQHGAARVHAIDVGSGQLDWKLRNDARVLLRERLNARYLRYEDIGELIDLAVCDVSFISATLILRAIGPLLQPAGEMVVLVKPQFEVGREQVGKGGIVRDPRLHQTACERIETAVRQMNFETDIIESPIRGAEGNKEFLLYARH
jgi:23S rRNA (cytidine1920-2'-O)/16S rRNA (cytidine1409-2'-O)-methyltransferase